MSKGAAGPRRRRARTPAEREAWLDGYRVADTGGARADRPNYLTHEEREAFKKGWDAKTRAKDREKAVREFMDEVLRHPQNSN